jgi:hypothetical protein
MNHIFGPVYSMTECVYAAVILLGQGGGYLTVAFAVLVILAGLGFIRRDPHARPRLWIPVLLLPAIWIFIGLWGGALRVEPGPGHQFQHGSWVQYPPTVAVVFSLIASIFFIIYQRGARLFVTCYSIINLYVTGVIFFIAAMEMTGTWI